MGMSKEVFSQAALTGLLSLDALVAVTLLAVFVFELVRGRRKSVEDWAPLSFAAVVWFVAMLVSWAIAAQLWSNL
jgi:hypothetical protein